MRVIAVLMLIACLAFAAGAASDGSVRFVAVSDTHLCRTGGGWTQYPATSRIVREITQKLRPDFVVHCGDMLNVNPPGRDVEEIEEMWGTFSDGVLDPVAAAGIPFFPCPGNHDVYGAARQLYRKKWEGFRNPGMPLLSGSYGAWYSFAVKGSLFVVIDGATLNLGAPQREWLKARLAESRPAYSSVFVVSHVGVAGGRRHPMERLDGESRAIIAEGKPDFVICGHQHEAALTHVSGVTQLCVGSAGETKPFNYALFTVKGRKASFAILSGEERP